MPDSSIDKKDSCHEIEIVVSPPKENEELPLNISNNILKNAYLYVRNGFLSPLSAETTESTHSCRKNEIVVSAALDYSPVLPDEVAVHAGDLLRIEEVFNDGWIAGKNLTTRKKGVFPCSSCPEPYNNPMAYLCPIHFRPSIAYLTMFANSAKQQIETSSINSVKLDTNQRSVESDAEIEQLRVSVSSCRSSSLTPISISKDYTEIDPEPLSNTICTCSYVDGDASNHDVSEWSWQPSEPQPNSGNVKQKVRRKIRKRKRPGNPEYPPHTFQVSRKTKIIVSIISIVIAGALIALGIKFGKEDAERFMVDDSQYTHDEIPSKILIQPVDRVQ